MLNYVYREGDRIILHRHFAHCAIRHIFVPSKPIVSPWHGNLCSDVQDTVKSKIHESDQMHVEEYCVHRLILGVFREEKGSPVGQWVDLFHNEILAIDGWPNTFQDAIWRRVWPAKAERRIVFEVRTIAALIFIAISDAVYLRRLGVLDEKKKERDLKWPNDQKELHRWILLWVVSLFAERQINGASWEPGASFILS